MRLAAPFRFPDVGWVAHICVLLMLLVLAIKASPCNQTSFYLEYHSNWADTENQQRSPDVDFCAPFSQPDVLGLWTEGAGRIHGQPFFLRMTEKGEQLILVWIPSNSIWAVSRAPSEDYLVYLPASPTLFVPRAHWRTLVTMSNGMVMDISVQGLQTKLICMTEQSCPMVGSSTCAELHRECALDACGSCLMASAMSGLDAITHPLFP